MKYENIYVAVDGSELSAAAVRHAVRIGSKDGGTVHGSHVYAARLHESRFKMMEGGLPDQYREEDVLENQRQVHDSLITKGLGLISDSYLSEIETLCKNSEVPFRGISLEGKNWRELVKDIEAGGYDLVAMGAHGVGRVDVSLLGTVVERVVRRVRRDVLICKKKVTENESDVVIVCLDGSSRSWGALRRGIALAKTFDKKMIAVSCFDPHFHYTMFNSINKVLTDEAREVVKFEEQEKLHEDIIDTGLAKMYRSYLDIAQRIGAEAGIEVSTRLLEGKAYAKILEFIDRTSPWLTIIGRIGSHSDEDMDIGGTTENICRMAGCDVLVVEAKFEPPRKFLAEAMLTWTREARARLETTPAASRTLVTDAIQDYCFAERHTVVTSALVDRVVGQLPQAGRVPEDASRSTHGETTDAHAGQGREPGPLWTDAAIERVERVPQGFMQTAARMAVEQYARTNNIAEITLEVAEVGLARARERMEAAMRKGAAARKGE